MTYIKSGDIRVLEEKGLKIKINYDSIIRKIDEELSKILENIFIIFCKNY